MEEGSLGRRCSQLCSLSRISICLSAVLPIVTPCLLYAGDPCPIESDQDADGVCDDVDNCPKHFNPDQADCDGDALGDVCAIATGQSGDCNENGVPDDCELGQRVKLTISDPLQNDFFGVSVAR